MQNNEIALFQKFGLAKNSNFNYSEAVNAFIGNGYTSMAGNTYLNEIRLIEGIIIKNDVGHGHTYTFLNGIKIFHIESKQLICERNYHNTQYGENYIKSEVKSMLNDLLISTSKKEGIQINKTDVEVHVGRIVNEGFATDQRIMLINQTQKYLNA